MVRKAKFSPHTSYHTSMSCSYLVTYFAVHIYICCRDAQPNAAGLPPPGRAISDCNNASRGGRLQVATYCIALNVRLTVSNY
eukprot:6191057-Pleurochrysis_carterae.AAC.3